jgi:hypothetical protein
VSNVFFGETGPIREPAAPAPVSNDEEEKTSQTNEKTLVGTSA